MFYYKNIDENNINIKEELEIKKGYLLNTILNDPKIGIWERNIKYDSYELNTEGHKMIGLELNAINHTTYNTWESLIHSKDLAKVKDKLNSCFNNKSEAYNIVYRLQNKEGRIIWIHDIGKILTWDGQEPILMYGTIQDITEKVNINTELEKLKNNQEAIINSTKDLLWSIDTDFNLIYANSAFQQLIKSNLGHELKVGDSVFSNKNDKQTNKQWKNYYKRVLKGELLSIKQSFKEPSKSSTTYGLTSFNPLFSKENIIYGLTCYTKDITKEILSQQVILNTNKGMRKILDASLDIICTVDKDGYFLSINKACKKIWGFEPKFLIGKKYMNFVWNKDGESTEKIFKSILSGENIIGFENTYIHKNKSLVPMRWSANWDDKEGVVYCVARDNTENKIAKQQLEQSEYRFKTLVQDGSDLLSIIDQEFNYTYVSTASNKIIGRTPEEIIGTNQFDYIHPDDYKRVYEQFSKIFEIPQLKIAPFRFKSGNNKWLWLMTTITNKSDDPFINGIIINASDVTERVLYLKEIEEQNLKLKEIGWTQAHIVRAPVARLMGLVYLIRDKKITLELEEKEFILDNIIKSAHEIDTIIKKIVDSTGPTLAIEEIE